MEKHFDLKTMDGRDAAKAALDAEALKSLREISPDFCTHPLKVRITRYTVTVFTQKDGEFLFASGVVFSRNSDGIIGINFSSSGWFTPEDTRYDAAFWRTLNAAAALRNWQKIKIWVNEYLVKKDELNTEIFAANEAK